MEGERRKYMTDIERERKIMQGENREEREKA
jgi:hypothetical protein